MKITEQTKDKHFTKKREHFIERFKNANTDFRNSNSKNVPGDKGHKRVCNKSMRHKIILPSKNVM